MNLIFLGPPGSGKGTQAKLVSQKLGLDHISSGELLRNATQKNDEKSKVIKALMNRGEFVPFDTVLDLIISRIENSPRGFILDGTPRDMAQAEHLDWFFDKHKISLDAAIFFKLSDNESSSRLFSRAKIEKRADDNEKVIKERIKIYHQQTRPVLSYYQAKDKLITIDASPSIEEIHQDLLQNLKNKSLI
jgi:adenylate kinase